jgi:copper resistance protein C
VTRRSWFGRLVGLALAVLPASTAPAWAHAIVLEAEPGVDATVTGPDVAVRIRFNSRIDHRRSRLTLLPAQGKPVTLAIDPKGGPAMLVARAAGLASGEYALRWQVLAEDGHITRGDIPFKVGR